MPPRPLRNLSPLIALIAACCALVALTPASRLAFDVQSSGGRTLVTVAIAFVHLAFEIGHSCPESNGCAGPRL